MLFEAVTGNDKPVVSGSDDCNVTPATDIKIGRPNLSQPFRDRLTLGLQRFQFIFSIYRPIQGKRQSADKSLCSPYPRH
jgi:hypothetical protein